MKIQVILNSQRKRGKAQEGEEWELDGREYTTEVIRTSEIVCERAWQYIQRYSKNGQELGKSVDSKTTLLSPPIC